VARTVPRIVDKCILECGKIVLVCYKSVGNELRMVDGGCRCCLYTFERIRRIETVGLLGGNLSFQTPSRVDPDLKNYGADV